MPSSKQWSYCLLLGLCLLSSVLFAGGGKEAFRNYFLGSYYFAEGVYSKAANHLQKAYQMDPEQYQFGLAYALALGQQKKSDEAFQVLNKSKGLLSAQHPDHKHLLSLQFFVTAMIHIYDQQYGLSVKALNQAILLQEDLLFPEERSVMLNTLGYVRIMNQGKGTGSHGGLGKHYHVHKRDLEKALLSFRQAYQADVQNTTAAENYQTLMDTLQRSEEFIVEDKVDRSQEKQLKTYQYKKLPANMQALVEFTKYDEVVFLLDISGSMVMEDVSCIGSDRFGVMKETAMLLLDNMDDSTKVGIGTIGGDCGTTPRLWHAAGSRSRKDLQYDLKFLVPDGTTPLLTILQETPALFTDDPNSSKTIVFISDGENICRLPGVDICEWSERLKSEHISINIMTFLGVNLNNTNAFAEYTCLSENTFGQLLYLDGDRCRLEEYEFDLVRACQLSIPELQKVNCWGKHNENLWAIFP